MPLAASAWSKRHPVIAYYALAVGIAWAGWVPFGASQAGLLRLRVPFEIPVLAQYGPSLAAIILVGFEAGKSGIGRLLRPALRWRVGVQWYAVALLLTPAVLLSVIGLRVLLGADVPDFTALGQWHVRFSEQERLLTPSMGLLSFLAEFETRGPWHTLLIFVILAIANGGLSEEFGWRGYALPRLQARRSALVASIALGLLWAFWHTDQDFWRTLFTSGTAAFAKPLTMVIVDLPLAVLFTWVYNNTRGSLLLAILFHASYNSTITITDLTWAPPGHLSPLVPETVLGLWVVALIVVAVYGPARLSRVTS